ncbi:MAG: hypothetical protein Q8O67_01840 [Deltaproteobacteria bacterium]|nr:hypothetical protein [Deltaproteobacteria bacterium]
MGFATSTDPRVTGSAGSATSTTESSSASRYARSPTTTEAKPRSAPAGCTKESKGMNVGSVASKMSRPSPPER